MYSFSGVNLAVRILNLKISAVERTIKGVWQLGPDARPIRSKTITPTSELS
jgi:hypothetical protein